MKVGNSQHFFGPIFAYPSIQIDTILLRKFAEDELETTRVPTSRDTIISFRFPYHNIRSPTFSPAHTHRQKPGKLFRALDNTLELSSCPRPASPLSSPYDWWSGKNKRIFNFPCATTLNPARGMLRQIFLTVRTCFSKCYLRTFMFTHEHNLTMILAIFFLCWEKIVQMTSKIVQMTSKFKWPQSLHC